MRGAIDADPDDAGEAAPARLRRLQQDTRQLGAAHTNVIGPFDARCRPQKATERRGQRDTRHKAKFRRAVLRRSIHQQKARIEIARGRDPLAPQSPLAAGLLHGADPERTGIAIAAARHGLVIGGAEVVENLQPIAALCDGGGKAHAQNSDLAAAAAATSSGPGQKEKNTTRRLATIRTAVTAGLARSKPGAGSSK